MTENKKSIECSIDKYLDRIGFTGRQDGSLLTLSRLQEAHSCSVPYENLDILRKRELSLDIEDLYNKVVVRKRGGYCFELNALFGWLLRELSYQVTDYFARFLRGEATIPMRRHRVLRVEVDGEAYLCDVGVGGPVPFRPVKLAEGLEQQQGDECYRMRKDSFLGWVLQERHHGEWRDLYSFTEEPQLPVDFVAANYYCQYSPDSIFNRQPMISIRTKDGRYSVDGNEFRTFSREGVKTFIPENDEEKNRALEQYFGIILD